MVCFFRISLSVIQRVIVQQLATECIGCDIKAGSVGIYRMVIGKQDPYSTFCLYVALLQGMTDGIVDTI